MDYRKIIGFGKSSYVVSLPKSWLKANKLKKGDLVYFDEAGSNLLMQAKAENQHAPEKEITINIEGKDLRRINREIISAYIRNYKAITVSGNDVGKKAKDIQHLIQNLIALEIMEQDSKKIIAKDFLNLNDISMDQILRKMDNITRSMIQDCQQMFQEDVSDSINHRDSDVNKFRFLVYRIVWFGIENPTNVLRNLKLNQKDLFTCWWMAHTIESIADCAKRAAQYLKSIDLSPPAKKKLLLLLKDIGTTYSDMMKAYYTNNEETAHKILEDRFSLIQECDKFYWENKNSYGIGYLTHNMKNMVATTCTIGRMIYSSLPG